MSDEIVEEKNQQQSDTIIITDNAEKVKNPLEVDTTKLTKNELLAFKRNDLFAICTKLKAFPADMPDYKKKRAKIKELVNYIKAAEKKAAEPKADNEEKAAAPVAQNEINIPLLQTAIIDIFTTGNAENLDKFAAETLKNNDAINLDQEQAEKAKKFLVNASLVHTIIRGFGGYKNLFAKGKELYFKLKNRGKSEDNHRQEKRV